MHINAHNNYHKRHIAKYIMTACIPKITIKVFLLFFSLSIRMSTSSINFNYKKIKKSDFYNKNKTIFNIDDIDVNETLVSKKEQYGKHNSFKYFIGYNDNDVIRPLYLELSQMTGYINEFDENNLRMSFIIKDKQLLKNYKKNMDKN